MQILSATNATDEDYDKVLIMLHGAAEPLYFFRDHMADDFFGDFSGIKLVFPNLRWWDNFWFQNTCNMYLWFDWPGCENTCGSEQECNYNLNSI